MSRSNFFFPGAKEVLNGTTIHLTSSCAKPRFVATAYATALSKPRPERGSLTFHGAFSSPPNQGGKAGLSVPTVSVPGLTRLRSPLSHDAPDVLVLSAEEPLEPPQPAARTASDATRIANEASFATASTLTRGYFSAVRVGRHDVAISNPDKLFFPERGLTKGDLVRYYLDVADCALPLLRRRPFHMKRYPHGVDGDFFHQKRVPAHPDYVDEQFVQFPSGHSTVFAVVDNAAALAWVINLGCIELHTWHSRVEQIERPDYLLIDLDPTFDGQWPHVRDIALVVRDVLGELELAAYPKTSGATGLHVLTPIKPELAFPEVRRFAKALAEEVERRIGDQEIATTTWRVADRRGVFVDFGQNARDRTIAAAYSVRPTPDARVSAPLLWDEVAEVDPAEFTVETMPDRIAGVGDPMAGMWRRKAS